MRFLNADIVLSNSNTVDWKDSTKISSPASGNFLLTNKDEDDLGLLQLGGTTNAYPAIKRTGKVIEIREATDLAYAPLSASNLTAYGDIQLGDYLVWDEKSTISSPVDGNLLLENYNAGNFNMLQFGGTTSSYPALKRNGNTLSVRTADDVSYSALSISNLGCTGYVQIGTSSYLSFNNRTKVTSPANGLMLVEATSGDPDEALGFVIGGQTTDDIMIKRRVGGLGILQIRKGDDSTWAPIYAGQSNFSGVVVSNTTAFVQWQTSSRISAPVNGNLLIHDSTNADFGLLQLGGITSAYPALKRSSTAIQARLADDSGWADLYVGDLFAYDRVWLDSSRALEWNGRSKITSPVNGDILITDSGGEFGGRVLAEDLVASGYIESPKVMMTPEGGVAIRLTNKTGSSSIKGEVIRASTGTDDAFILTAATNDDDAMGIVYEAGVADGSECWVVVNGIAEVLLDDSTAATRGNWVRCGTAAGRADATTVSPPGLVLSHFQEIGHCIQSAGAGTDVLARTVLHFN